MPSYLEDFGSLNEFDFNWNDYRTIAHSQAKADEIALKIKSSMCPEDVKSQQQLGQLSYKLGTFYNHIKRTPDAAMENLAIAEKLLSGEELAWTQNHIAFSYQQKFASASKSGDAKGAEKNRQMAIEYCNKVTGSLRVGEKTKIEEIKIIGFAHCVKALIEYENKQLNEALQSYRYALDLYEKHKLLDDQYIRAKNRWAMMLAENKQIHQAEQAFREIEEYWIKNNDSLNPYPARFYVMYGDFLTQSHTNNPKLALQKYQAAYRILRNVEGESSPFVKDILKKITDIQRNSPIGIHYKFWNKENNYNNQL